MRDPSVIGIIPDGNRRYARKYGIPYPKAYRKGVETAKRALTYITENTDVKYAYFYTLSLENLKNRSKRELSVLFRLLEKELQNVLENNPWDARISFAGRPTVLPRRIQELLERVRKHTENNGGVHVILNIAYTGLSEIVDLARRIVREGIPPEEINEESIWRYTYVHTPPADFILRTSGEKRLSGFLPLHGLYAELIFYPKLWPEMDFPDFDAVFEEYRARDRRFGR